MQVKEVHLIQGVSFDQGEMVRKRWIHGHDGVELVLESPCIWIQRVNYQGKERVVREEIGVPLANVTHMTRTAPAAGPGVAAAKR